MHMTTPVHRNPPMRSFPDQRPEWREKSLNRQPSPAHRKRGPSTQQRDDRVQTHNVRRDARSSRQREENFRAAPPVPRVDFFVQRFAADFQRLWLLLDVRESKK